MFDIRGYISSPKDIPSKWIFERYLKLNTSLRGQTVMVRSVFNNRDRTPSMSLYYNERQRDYRYKCFSTGESGDGLSMLCQMWDADFSTTYNRVKEEYIAYKTNGLEPDTDDVISVKEMRPLNWKVGELDIRLWNTNDAALWKPFNITSTMLEKHNVFPLASYTMWREQVTNCDRKDSFTIEEEYVYGYFTKNGELYKIYRPRTKKNKFMKVKNYLQGSDQLKGYPTLIICSSLKDLMCMKSLGIRSDFVAPDSENSMIEPSLMENLKSTYETIITLFDNDDAGIRNMLKYEKEHHIPYAYVPLSKDISDSVRDYGTETVIQEVVPRIHRSFDKYRTDVHCNNYT